MEYYLAYPLRWLASWVGVKYDGEFRNGHAAHVGFGWGLTLTLCLFTRYLAILCVLYGVFREFQDAGWSFAWVRKNWADLFTWTIGSIIGLLWSLLI